MHVQYKHPSSSSRPDIIFTATARMRQGAARASNTGQHRIRAVFSPSSHEGERRYHRGPDVSRVHHMSNIKFSTRYCAALGKGRRMTLIANNMSAVLIQIRTERFVKAFTDELHLSHLSQQWWTFPSYWKAFLLPENTLRRHTRSLSTFMSQARLCGKAHD